MAEAGDPKDVVTVQELAISNMYEIGALIELLDQKGIVTKQEILDMIQELRRKTPQAERYLVKSPSLAVDNPDN